MSSPPIYILTVLYVYHYGGVWDLLAETERCVPPQELVHLAKEVGPEGSDLRITIYSPSPTLIPLEGTLYDVLDRVDALGLTIEQRQLVVHCAGCYYRQGKKKGKRPVCAQCGQELPCGIGPGYHRMHYYSHIE